MIGWIIAGIILLLLIVAALMELTGRLSRQEEREMLARCPWCGVSPQLGYACGEYFIHGNDPDCPYCGTAFTEMHSDPRMEIDSWNRRAEDGNTKA